MLEDTIDILPHPCQADPQEDSTHVERLGNTV